MISEDDTPERISRTRKKKAALALQELGERLVNLSDAQLARFDLGEALTQAVTDAREMKQHGARRRQLQYIGTLMRQIDAAPIQEMLERISLGREGEARRFKLVEKWRDELLGGDSKRLEWLIGQYAGLDRDKLSELVRFAGEGSISAPERRKNARELFRYLHQNIPT
jgi:ribosome-associated protein